MERVWKGQLPFFSLEKLQGLGLSEEEARKLRRELQRLDRYERRLWGRVRENEVTGIEIEDIPLLV